MARLVTSGFELNDLHANGPLLANGGADFTGSGGSVVTSPVRTGTYAWQANSGGGSTLSDWFTVALATGYYYRIYVFLSQLPAAGTTINLNNVSAGASLHAQIRCDETGAASLWYSTTSPTVGDTQVGSTLAGAFVASQWIRLEVYSKIGSGTVDEIGAMVNGQSVASATGLAIADTAATAHAHFRNPGASGVTVTVDDCAVNDSTGASQNSWPGDGKVVYLKPISDNAVGTGWTLGTGTATGGNAFEAVNNTPPTGVADLTALSDPKQIRNASSNANSSYDANLQTYAAAGIGTDDTVNVLVPIVSTAAPVTTSAKAGTIGIASNPAIANIALAALGTPGAFWSGNTAGTYASGWKWSFGTTTYAPAVAKGTAPVARITQVTSSTRIAMVCALGMYVDYTPGPSHGPPPRTPRAARTTPAPGAVYA